MGEAEGGAITSRCVRLTVNPKGGSEAEEATKRGTTLIEITTG